MSETETPVRPELLRKAADVMIVWLTSNMDSWTNEALGDREDPRPDLDGKRLSLSLPELFYAGRDSDDPERAPKYAIYAPQRMSIIGLAWWATGVAGGTIREAEALERYLEMMVKREENISIEEWEDSAACNKVSRLGLLEWARRSMG